MIYYVVVKNYNYEDEEEVRRCESHQEALELCKQEEQLNPNDVYRIFVKEVFDE